MKSNLGGFWEQTVGMPAEVRARFEPLRVIGTGGMGTVVLARERARRRLVALKVLRETCGLFLVRFRREAELMTRLRHRAIVPVHGYHEVGGRPTLVLDYVRGGNLGQARLEPLALGRVLRDVVAALAHAHAHGVVHRDVKPENVLLDGGGRAFLTDFGLALLAREGRTRAAVAGTLHAMSPEQVRGESLGPASDQFSFGVTFYRALTGEWPHRGRTVADVIHAIEHEEPVPPRVLAPGVTAGIQRIVLRCLAKAPDARFASMEALDRALARELARRPALPRLLAFVQRRRRARGGRAVHPPSVAALPPLEEPIP